MTLLSNTLLCKKLTDKALEPYDTSWEEVFSRYPTGYIGKKLWNNHYCWNSAESYNQYRDWAMTILEEEYDGDLNKVLEAYNEYDMALGLKESYLW